VEEVRKWELDGEGRPWRHGELAFVSWGAGRAGEPTSGPGRGDEGNLREGQAGHFASPLHAGRLT